MYQRLLSNMSLKIIKFMLLVLCLGWPTINVLGEYYFNCRVPSPPQFIRLTEDLFYGHDIGHRSFVLNKGLLWRRPNPKIPYKIDRKFSKAQVKKILDTMKMFRNVSCVDWVPRRGEFDYVFIKHHHKPKQCTSKVGRKGGMQFLKLGNDCFNDTGFIGSIPHEMMHTMGFIHEHQRIDRNCFVKVNREMFGILPSDFKIEGDTDISFPYDFRSIMHYYHTVQGKRAIRGHHKETLGKTGVLTKGDIAKLNFLYCGGPTFCKINKNECLKLKHIQNKCGMVKNV